MREVQVPYGTTVATPSIYRFFVFLGTFAPELRASERPMAIACLRLVTRLPDRPLFSVPRLRSRIARSTFSPAFFPYLAMHTLHYAAGCMRDLCRKHEALEDQIAVTKTMKLYACTKLAKSGQAPSRMMRPASMSHVTVPMASLV
jgi:hypothetical protein